MTSRNKIFKATIAGAVIATSSGVVPPQVVDAEEPSMENIDGGTPVDTEPTIPSETGEPEVTPEEQVEEPLTPPVEEPEEQTPPVEEPLTQPVEEPEVTPEEETPPVEEPEVTPEEPVEIEPEVTPEEPVEEETPPVEEPVEEETPPVEETEEPIEEPLTPEEEEEPIEEPLTPEVEEPVEEETPAEPEYVSEVPAKLEALNSLAWSSLTNEAIQEVQDLIDVEPTEEARASYQTQLDSIKDSAQKYIKANADLTTAEQQAILTLEDLATLKETVDLVTHSGDATLLGTRYSILHKKINAIIQVTNAETNSERHLTDERITELRAEVALVSDSEIKSNLLNRIIQLEVKLAEYLKLEAEINTLASSGEVLQGDKEALLTKVQALSNEDSKVYLTGLIEAIELTEVSEGMSALLNLVRELETIHPSAITAANITEMESLMVGLSEEEQEQMHDRTHKLKKLQYDYSYVSGTPYVWDGVNYGHFTISASKILTRWTPPSVDASPTFADTKHLILPEGITSIAGPVFLGNKDFETITLPSTVLSITDRAFLSTSLKEVTIPSKTEIIGEQVFFQSKLEKLTFEEGSNLRTIGGSSFAYTQLKTLVAPPSLTTINSSAFAYSNLTSITLNEGLTSLGASAFLQNKLTQVTLPRTVTVLTDSVFANNYLTKVNLSPLTTAINSYSFNNNALTEITIPDSVTTIGYGSFSNNQIASIKLGNRVTTIDTQAFYINKLKEVTIPESVTTIRDNAFTSNPDLNYVRFLHTDNKLTISTNAFNAPTTSQFFRFDHPVYSSKASGVMRNIKWQDDPTGALNIYRHSEIAAKPTHVTSVQTIINKVTNEEYKNIYQTRLDSIINDVAKYVVANEAVTDLEVDGVKGKDTERVKALVLLVTDEVDKAELTQRFTNAVQIAETSDMLVELEGRNHSKLTSLELLQLRDLIQDTAGPQVIQNYLSRLATLQEGYDLYTAAETALAAIESADKIVKVDLDAAEVLISKVKDIADKTAMEERVKIIKKDKEYVLVDTTAIEAILLELDSKNPKLISPEDIARLDAELIKMPWQQADIYQIKVDAIKQKKADYTYVSGTDYIKNGINYGKFTITDAGVWTKWTAPSDWAKREDKTLEMPKTFHKAELPTVYYQSVARSSLYSQGITKLNIPDTVTHIGDSAFLRMSALKEVNLPSSIVEIGNSAFQLTAIENLTIPGSVKKIGTSAFSSSQIKNLTIEDGVATIGNTAFSSNKLVEVTLPSSVISLGTSTFASNELVSVDLSKTGISLISKSAFSDNKIEDLKLPTRLSSIAENAFEKNQLRKVTMPDSLGTIMDTAFENNIISELNLNEGLQVIENGAFRNNQLTSLVIPSSVDTIDASAFGNNVDLIDVTFNHENDTLSIKSASAFPSGNDKTRIYRIGTDGTRAGKVMDGNKWNVDPLAKLMVVPWSELSSKYATQIKQAETKLASYTNVELRERFLADLDTVKSRAVLYKNASDAITGLAKSTTKPSPEQVESIRIMVDRIEHKMDHTILTNRLNSITTYSTITTEVYTLVDKAPHLITEETLTNLINQANAVTDPEYRQELLTVIEGIKDKQRKYADAKSALTNLATVKPLTQYVINVAKGKVGSVDDPKLKEELLAELQQHQDQYEIELINTKLTEYGNVVVNRLTKEQLDELKARLDKLDPSLAYTELDKLDKLYAKLEAYNKALAAVLKVETSLTNADLAEAEDLLFDLPADRAVDRLTDRLKDVEGFISSYDKVISELGKEERKKDSILTQANLDLISNLIWDMPATFDATDVLNRLNELQVRLNNYKAAEKEVVKAEASGFQTDVDNAKTVIARVTTELDKASLLARLDAIRINPEPEIGVERDLSRLEFNTSPRNTESEVNRVQALISKLNHTMQDIYQPRLDQVVLDKEAYNLALEFINLAKAEPTNYNIGEARYYVSQITKQVDKTSLESMLRSLVPKETTDAMNNLNTLEGTPVGQIKEQDLTQAQSFINQVDEASRKPLQERLDEIIADKKEYDDSKRAVDKAQSQASEDNIQAAKELVNTLAPSDERDALLTLIDKLENPVSITDVEDKFLTLNEKQPSKISNSELTAVQDLINKLKEPNRSYAQSELDTVKGHINDYKDALTSVQNASRTGDVADIDAAEIKVSTVHNDADRAYLEGIINTLKDKLVTAEKEKEKEITNNVGDQLTYIGSKQPSKVTGDDIDNLTQYIMQLPADKRPTYQQQLEELKQTVNHYNNAKTAVDNAKNNPTVENVNIAKEAISYLPEGVDKNNFTSVVNNTTPKEYNELYDRLYQLMNQPKSSVTEGDITNIKNLISKLPAADRTTYQEKLDAVDNSVSIYKEAEKYVSEAEHNPTVSSIKEANDYINRIANASDRTILKDRISNLTPSEYTDLSNNLVKLEKTNLGDLTQTSIDRAQELISKLPSADRYAYQSRLDKVNENKWYYDAALTAVEKAEDNPTERTIKTATDRVNRLPDGVDKDDFLDILADLVPGSNAVTPPPTVDAGSGGSTTEEVDESYVEELLASMETKAPSKVSNASINNAISAISDLPKDKRQPYLNRLSEVSEAVDYYKEVANYINLAITNPTTTNVNRAKQLVQGITNTSDKLYLTSMIPPVSNTEIQKEVAENITNITNTDYSKLSDADFNALAEMIAELNGSAQASYQQMLDKVINDKLNYDRAIVLVETAKESGSVQDINVAFDLLSQLSPNDGKARLLTEINNISPPEQARVNVALNNLDRPASQIGDKELIQVREMISELPNDRQQYYTEKLDTIEGTVETYKDAYSAVTRAYQYPSIQNIEDARKEIANVTNLIDKNNLLDRVISIEETLTEDKPLIPVEPPVEEDKPLIPVEPPMEEDKPSAEPPVEDEKPLTPVEPPVEEEKPLTPAEPPVEEDKPSVEPPVEEDKPSTNTPPEEVEEEDKPADTTPPKEEDKPVVTTPTDVDGKVEDKPSATTPPKEEDKPLTDKPIISIEDLLKPGGNVTINFNGNTIINQGEGSNGSITINNSVDESISANDNSTTNTNTDSNNSTTNTNTDNSTTNTNTNTDSNNTSTNTSTDNSTTNTSTDSSTTDNSSNDSNNTDNTNTESNNTSSVNPNYTGWVPGTSTGASKPSNNSSTAGAVIGGGGLSINAAKTSDFGSIKLDPNKQKHYASFDSSIALEVVDSRGTGQGWNVTVSATPFRSVNDDGSWGDSALPKGSLSMELSGGKFTNFNPDGSGGMPVIVPNLTSVIIDSGAVTIAQAKPGTGMGQFGLVFEKAALGLTLDPSKVKISVDDSGEAVPYKSTITWSLTSDSSTNK